MVGRRIIQRQIQMAMTANHSSYHHLSTPQIRQLSFNVKIRCVRNRQPDRSGDSTGELNSNSCLDDETSTEACEPLTSEQVRWQEKIDRPSFHRSVDANTPVAIFTNTNGDDVFFPGESAEAVGRWHRRDETKDRLFRENPCEAMRIMAAVQNDASGTEEIILCTIKVHKNGVVIATPAFSREETEDLFMSNRGIDEAIISGRRMSTYTFQTNEGSVYEYSIEINEQQRTDGCDNDQFIATQNDLDREIIDTRRALIRKDHEDSGRLYEDYCSWTSQARVEIVSATGFQHENMLLSTPFRSNLMIRYELKAVNVGCKNTVPNLSHTKGHTNVVQSFALVHSSIEFMVQFTTAFAVVIFAATFVFGDIRIDCSETILLSIIPLILMLKHSAQGVDVIYNFNHQFQFSFDKTRNESNEHERIVLELSAFHLHNFGVTALAGCGIMDVPTQQGDYVLDVITWKPLARTSIGKTRCQLHSYYLGSCLDEICPFVSVQSPANEEDWLNEPKKLFSKNDLHTTLSGIVKIRINVTNNHFSREKLDANSMSGEYAPNGFIRETVDGVLRRIRRNKRERMAEDRAEDPLLHVTEDVATDIQGNLSSRAATVLEKVRSSRKSSANQA